MDEFERRSLRLKRTVINEKIDFSDNLFTELKVKGLLDKDMVELIQVSLGVGMWGWEEGVGVGVVRVEVGGGCGIGSGGGSRVGVGVID